MTGARIVAILIAITIATVANISCGSKPVSLEVSRCFPVCRRKRTPYPNVSAWSAASLFRTRPWRTRGVEEAKGSLRVIDAKLDMHAGCLEDAQEPE